MLSNSPTCQFAASPSLSDASEPASSLGDIASAVSGMLPRRICRSIWTLRPATLAICAALLLLSWASISQAQTVTATVPVGMAPGSVAVNPVTNKMYVTNQNDGTVTVIDGATNKTTTVKVGNTPVGASVNTLTNKIYIANAGSSNVTVIDGLTNAPTTVPAGGNPDSTAINPVTNKIYVTNQIDGTVTVINGATNATTTLTVGAAPLPAVVNPVTNKIYVANNHGATVSVIDGTTNAITTLQVGVGPDGAAINLATNKIYIPNFNDSTVSVIDGASNTVTATIKVGTNPLFVTLNAVTNKIYTANNGSSDVTVIDGATNTTVAVALQAAPGGIALNPVTNTIFVPNPSANIVTIIDGATNAASTLMVGPGPGGVAVNPVTNKIYVANATGNNVSVIDGATNVTATVGVGTAPDAVAVNPVTNLIYVVNENENSDNVTVIDGATNTTTTVAVGKDPQAVAVNPVTNKIYVPNFLSNNVTVIDGATNTTTTVTDVNAKNPIAVAVNPVTNQIYVANSGSNNVSVINGATNATTTVADPNAAGPMAVAVNPVTNQIYVANQTSNNVTVISGVTNITTTVTDVNEAFPVAVAVNPVTNQIYIANSGSNNVAVINGLTDAVTTVTDPNAVEPAVVAVNPVTNKIYVANLNSANVTVIDGATNNTTTVATGASPQVVVVNAVTNKIYVASSGADVAAGGNVTVIDGATNNTTTVATGLNPDGAAVNPVTNQIYVANTDISSNSVTVITEEQVSQIPLATTITPLAGNQTTDPTPTFTFTAASTFAPTAAPVLGIFFQIDTWQGPWIAAAPVPGGGFSGAAPTLTLGTHILYAYATDGQDSTSVMTTIFGGCTPLTGAISAYLFLVTNPANPATHFSVSAPANATAGTAFNVTVTALDASNATATGYAGTVHFTSTDGNAVLPANSTLTNGAGTFAVTLKTAGAQTVTATDTVIASITGMSGTIMVTSVGPTAMLAISKTHVGNFTQGQHSAQYTVTVSNASNGAPTSGTVTVTDTSLNALAQDFAASFSGASNPNDVWSYGQFVESTSTFTLLPGQNAAFPTCGLPYWSGTGYPDVIANNSGSTVSCGTVTVPNDTLWMHPTDTAGTDSDVRFTAPASGTYEITGSFSALDTTSTLDSILVNGAPVFSTFICNPGNGNTCGTTNTRAPFSVVQTLGAGSTVDFIVNCCSGPDQTFLFDSTGLSGAIDTNLSGLSLVSMSGTGWMCGAPNPANTCTRSDALAPGASYPPISVLVNVGVNASSPQVNTVSVSGGGSATANHSDSTVITPAPSAQLTITKTHAGSFTQGQQGAQYSLTVANSPGAAPTSGTVTVTETAPTGLTLVAMGGTGWTCGSPNSANVCTRSDALGAGASYPVITITVNVTANATSPQVNTAAVTGGGSAQANASDSTVIVSASTAATHFSVTAPANATAGTVFDFIVTALTSSNTTATGYTGTVHFTSTDGKAVLPANSPLTNGTGTFPATLNIVGNQTITATDTVTATIKGTSGTINVSAVVAQMLTVQTAGTGTGMVTGAGINCTTGSANGCTASLAAGTQVVLTQAATNGSTFAGWNGAPTMCSVAGATCTFTMPAAAETVTATFTAGAPILKSIAVTPANPTEPVNSTLQFTATGTFSDNSTKNLTSIVAWASSNTKAATISAGGLATTGPTAGLTTTVSATQSEVQGSTLLTVSNSPITITVTPPLNGVPPTVPPGGKIAIGIVITAIPPFTGTVKFGCATSSVRITCQPDPSSITFTTSGPTQEAIVVNTFCTGTSTAYTPNPGEFEIGGGLGMLLLSIALGAFAWTYRKSPRWALSFAVLTLFAFAGVACSSLPKGPNGVTPPGNYSVTITATVNGTTTSTPPIPFTVE